MFETDQTTTLGTLGRRLGKTALGALGNRGELLAVEWQQEKGRLTQLLILSIALMFLAILGALLLTLTIIFLFPETAWKYVAGAFALLYLGGAAGIVFYVKTLIKQEPFSETIAQVKKDAALFNTFQ